jgi:cytochrome P450
MNKPERIKPLAEETIVDPAIIKCPYSFYQRLHAEQPVFRDPVTGMYVVSKYTDMQALIKDTKTFSNDLMLLDKVPHKTPTEAQRIFREEGFARPQCLQRNDPPQHTRFRKLVDRAFTASRVRELTPYIDDVVRQLIDDMIAANCSGPNGIDFVRMFAVPLPCIVIADQLGMPREDIPDLKKWSDALLDPTGLMISPEREIECAKQVVEFQHYFARKIEERRQAPRDDIMTALVQHMDGSDAPLTTEEILNLMEQLLTGGNETTTSTLSAALLLLIQHPEQEQQLRADPSPEAIRNFVEEALRMETPVQGLFRQTTAEAVVSGVTIPKDSIVMLRHGAVNRDPERFDAPDSFDVQRKNAGAQLAFGAGVHFCPGAMLARQELASAFTQLLDRFERFELVQGQPTDDYRMSFFLRGLNQLWVRMIPKAA